MSSSFQDNYDKPEPTEPYKPHSVEKLIVSGQLQGLVLQVNIANRCHKILLSTDDLRSHGLSGPAAADELRKIRETLERLVPASAYSQETE